MTPHSPGAGQIDDYFSAGPPSVDEGTPVESKKDKQTRSKTSSPPKSAYKHAGPSSLTLQLKRHSNPSSTQTSREVSPMRPDPTKTIPEMIITTPSASGSSEGTSTPDATPSGRKVSQHLGRIAVPMQGTTPTDTTPLLTNASLPTYMSTSPHVGTEPTARPEPRRAKSLGKRFRLALGSSIENAKTATKPGFWTSLLQRSFLALPAVFLGLLLNILDGVSYGMILFPAGKIFNGFGPMGVSMFFVT